MTKIIKRADGYWITDLPLNTPDCGPYKRLNGSCVDNDAKAALKALEKFFLFDYWELMQGKGKRLKVKTKKLT